VVACGEPGRDDPALSLGCSGSTACRCEVGQHTGSSNAASNGIDTAEADAKYLRRRCLSLPRLGLRLAAQELLTKVRDASKQAAEAYRGFAILWMRLSLTMLLRAS
jgi:hypothetical protein